MGKHEKVLRFFGWYREHRAKMVAAQHPGIKDETLIEKRILRGINSHPEYMNLAQAWRATGLPPSIMEMESVMENEEAETENLKAQNRHMYYMFK